MSEVTNRELYALVATLGVAAGSLIIGYSNWLNYGYSLYSMVPLSVGAILLVAQAFWIRTDPTGGSE